MTDEIALITGGCGFVGYHITKALLEENGFSSLHVFTRTPDRNLLPTVQYHAGSITSEKDITAVLTAIRPTVIFHVASPSAAGNVKPNAYFEVNVTGTKALLKAASQVGSVKAFIYTSSSGVAQFPHRNVDESMPLLRPKSKTASNYYPITKAMGDVSVLEASSVDGFRTCCLRITIVYGERDNQFFPGLLGSLESGQQKYQVGKNEPADFVSVTNVARAHMRAYKTLLQEFEEGIPGKASGEAFYITDDNPVGFWTFARQVWEAAGYPFRQEDVVVVRQWVVLGLAAAVEWICLVFTFGQVTLPGTMRPYSLRSMSEESTFSTEKAKRILNYIPVDDRQENIDKGVAWELRDEGKPKKSPDQPQSGVRQE